MALPARNLIIEDDAFRSTRGRRAGQYRQKSNVVIDPKDFGELREMMYAVFAMALRQEQAEGDLLEPTIITDNVWNKSPLLVDRKIEAIDPGGLQAAEVVSFVYEQIIKRSPIDTGAYISSHVIQQNGKIVSDPTDMRLAQRSDVITITNPLPYAKKIEQGLSNQAPRGVYRLAAIAAQNKFRRIARIKFTYRPISRLGDIMSGNLRTGSGRGRGVMADRKVFRRIGRRGERMRVPERVTHVYPTIYIWPQIIGRKGGRPSRASHAAMRWQHPGKLKPRYQRTKIPM